MERDGWSALIANLWHISLKMILLTKEHKGLLIMLIARKQDKSQAKKKYKKVSENRL